MISVGPVQTAATFPADFAAGGAILGPTFNARILVISVVGNNVLCQIKKGKRGQDAWLEPFSLITSTIVFLGEDTTAVRFADETPGAHGTVRAQIWEQPDPLPGSFGPIFSAGIGGINMNIYSNGALVGNEPGLDFLTGEGITWTVTDVPGTKVTVKADDGVAAALTTIGDIPYLSATGPKVYSRLADVAVGQHLISGGVGVAPKWSGVGTAGYVWTANGAGNDASWQAPSAGGGLAYVNSSPSDPAGTTSTNIAGVMMGIAVQFTPTQPTIFASIVGMMDNNTANTGRGVAVIGRYGTGTPPTNGAAASGTVFGTFKQQINTASVNPRVGFTCQRLIGGLTPGTQYWLDLSVKAIVAGTASVYDLDVTAFDFDS